MGSSASRENMCSNCQLTPCQCTRGAQPDCKGGCSRYGLALNVPKCKYCRQDEYKCPCRFRYMDHDVQVRKVLRETNLIHGFPLDTTSHNARFYRAALGPVCAGCQNDANSGLKESMCGLCGSCSHNCRCHFNYNLADRERELANMIRKDCARESFCEGDEYEYHK